MLLPSWVTNPTGPGEPNALGLSLALSTSRWLPEDFFCWRRCAVGKVLQRTQWTVWGDMGCEEEGMVVVGQQRNM